MMNELLLGAFVLATIPAVNVAWNLWLYRPAPKFLRGRFATDGARPVVSVLIPARDEEKNIEKAVRAVLSNRDIALEVIVMDDDSDDQTARIVRSLAAEDARVSLVTAPPLPMGWCGKTHACARLAEHGQGEFFLFVDADVELGPDAVGRMVAQLEDTATDLISSVPRQITGAVLEQTIIPLIHFVLLGYLPLVGMRRNQSAAWAAGCGQLFMARRQAYEAAGGHDSFRGYRHDGLWLPRMFRRAGYKTDLFDSSDLAVCRMYDQDPELLKGFTKNATEGMASPGAILPWTILLFGGQVLPFLLLPLALSQPGSFSVVFAILSVGLVLGTRLALSIRFKQSVLGAILHPVGILLILGIQWFALFQSFSGKAIAWKGRV